MRASGWAGSRPRKLIPIPPVPPRTRQQLFLAISKPGSNPFCLSCRGKPRFWPSRGGFPPAPDHRSGLSLLPTNIRSGQVVFVVQAIWIDRGLPAAPREMYSTALPEPRLHLVFWMLMCPGPRCKPHSVAGCSSLPLPGASPRITPKSQQGPTGIWTPNAQDGTPHFFEACWTDRRLCSQPGDTGRGEVFRLGGGGPGASVHKFWSWNTTGEMHSHTEKLSVSTGRGGTRALAGPERDPKIKPKESKRTTPPARKSTIEGGHLLFRRG